MQSSLLRRAREGPMPRLLVGIAMAGLISRLVGVWHASLRTSITPRTEMKGNSATHLNKSADDERRAECQEKPDPWTVLEGFATEATHEEGIGGPDRAGDRCRAEEAPTAVADEATCERYRCSTSWDEATDDDQTRTVVLECTFGPRAAMGALFTREESPINSWSEMLTNEVGQIVAKERAEGGECHEHRDSRVHTAGCCYTESNDRGLAWKDWNDGVEARDDECDDVRDR
jgi:hypothetical protein